MKSALMTSLELKGLRLAPSQVWNGIRLVPVLRKGVKGDLRVVKQKIERVTSVYDSENQYYSYVPHALTMSWTEDESPSSAFGAKISEGSNMKRFASDARRIRVLHRQVKRQSRNQIRFLPFHLAMEGFLSLHYGGPEIAWQEYSKQIMRKGIGPRVETSFFGQSIVGFEEALRVFEIHEEQVGVLIFVSEAFASAMILSHPTDYRDLHSSLLRDFYGELLVQYGLYTQAASMQYTMDLSGIQDFGGLASSLEAMKTQWSEVQEEMASGIFGRPLQTERIYDCGPFCLQRFVTDLTPKNENHIGEAIVRDDGTIEYLKTYRLSAAQTRRAYLLKQLALYEWNISETAASFGQSSQEFIGRLENAGFGYLIRTHLRPSKP